MILRNSEKQYMEGVYKVLDNNRQTALDAFCVSKKYVESGSYEEQDSFTAFGAMASANSRLRSSESLFSALYRSPYFAHIELENENGERSHFFLSDCDQLDQIFMVDTLDEMAAIVPFKQDDEKPLFSLLFHFYQAKKEEKKTVNGTTYLPKLICNDDICNRVLNNVLQLFPEEAFIDADELLEQILNENRNDPKLKNIISTLQRLQFEIIESDISKSFIVQGCAGSGKSQCLVHRLFYLRDTLSASGWDQVLLLTATQLFRNYSMELMKRYQLASINNCSVAELYRDLLNEYDDRFKSRQYMFELSEEYLPDEYLKEVYNPNNIKKIESEILNAIEEYVKSGCHILGIPVPAAITAEYISELVEKLDNEIALFDIRENELKKNPEYIGKKEKYEELLKQIASVKRDIQRIDRNLAQTSAEEDSFLELIHSLDDAEKEMKCWSDDRAERIRSAKEVCISICSESFRSDDVLLPWEYGNSLFRLKELLHGKSFKQDEDYLEFLTEYVSQSREELNKSLNKNQTVDQKLKYFENRKRSLKQRRETLNLSLSKLENDGEAIKKWINSQVNEFEGEQRERAIQRHTLSEVRYPLTRLESTVFEKEIWNSLKPLKEKYEVKTIEIAAMENGRQKESRILYKSDLLFYLMIYCNLHPTKEVKPYRLICVDEGQDLHKADYDMLHKIYPNAVFNVFGDVEQVLHLSCGIQDWESEAGISTVYRLNRNYRNTAGIVDFCNQRFDANMEYVGKARENQKPMVISDIDTLGKIALQKDMTVIVKNQDEFNDMCLLAGLNPDIFEFIDTHATQPVGKKIPCYSIFAAKGLEFTSALVFDENMTRNQKMVACTRAMDKLYYYEG